MTKSMRGFLLQFIRIEEGKGTTAPSREYVVPMDEGLARWLKLLSPWDQSPAGGYFFLSVLPIVWLY